MTPWLIKMIANTKEIGIRILVEERIVSTQKFPRVVFLRRTRQRMNAAASAMPTAAEMN